MTEHEEHQVTTYTGHDVVDQAGHKIGAVTDVIADRSTLEPRWMVVDTGMLKAAHYVPVDGVYRTDDDHLVVPFTRQAIKNAPKAHGDHILTADAEQELCDYYFGLAS